MKAIGERRSRYTQLRVELLEDRRLLAATAVPTISLAQGLTGTATPQAPLGPADLAAYYGFNNVMLNGITGNGAGQTIAIVDAFNDPKLILDVQQFVGYYSQQTLIGNPAYYPLPQFGQAGPTLTILNQNGGATLPVATDSTGDWEAEEALDVEMAHTVAPYANIAVYEANSADSNDISTAIQSAAASAGLPTGVQVSVVSMSLSMFSKFDPNTGVAYAYEDPGESAFDSDFTRQGVTFVASSGDDGDYYNPDGYGGYHGSYPAMAPDVLSVGGTVLTKNQTQPATWTDTAWSGSDGGPSYYVNEPSYQSQFAVVPSTFASFNGGVRRVSPDVAFDSGIAPTSTSASPGDVNIYDSFGGTSFNTQNGNWFPLAGTSVGAPAWSGMVAIADQLRVDTHLGVLSSSQTLQYIYGLDSVSPSTFFNDITSGGNGQYPAAAGYDRVTGMGTPKASALIPQIAESYASDPQLAGSWFYNTASQESIAQSGGSLTFTDTSGAFTGIAGSVSQGLFITADQVIATSGSMSGFVGTIVSTPTALEVQWSNGTVWQQPELAGDWFSNGTLLCTVTQTAGQSGTSLTFDVPSTNNFSYGSFNGRVDQVVATSWGIVGTIVSTPTALEIVWSNNTVWQQPYVAGQWFYNNQPCWIGESSSGLQIVNNIGGYSPGSFYNATTIEATGWFDSNGHPLMGTVTWTPAGEQIQWSNGTVMVQPSLGQTWFSPGQSTPDTLTQTSGGIMLKAYNNSFSHAVIVNSNTIYATDWELTGALVWTSSGLDINWANNTAWQQPELNGQWSSPGNYVDNLFQTAAGMYFINYQGGLSPGVLLSTTEVEATGWAGGLTGNIVTTSTGLEIDWANSTIWSQPAVLGAWYYNGQQYFVSEDATGLMITYPSGSSAGSISSATTISTVAWGTGTVSSPGGVEELSFGNGMVWTRS